MSSHTESKRLTGSIWNTKDPRGPMRTIVEVVTSAGPTLLTLSCGHVGTFANHFTYKVGAETHCFQCGPCAHKSDEEVSK